MTESVGESKPAQHFVVIGSSAGGIEALMTILSSLPADFPAPVVIAQHLDPAHPSQLVEILSRRCVLPVQLVAEQEPFKAGTVYIVPANQQVEITDNTVHVEPGGEVGPRPSVDRLFASAAAAFGEQLIAVVLSGTGFDGAAGARIVHAGGGTVIIQNPETAAFPGMPHSLAPATVDIIANAEEISPILQQLVSDSDILETRLNQESFQQILDVVREHRGVDFSQYRRPTILRRLHRRMAAVQAPSLAGYLQYLRENPGEEEQLVSNFLIKVTDFFRDTRMFGYLREKILPELIDAAKDQPEGLRIWSAGCATGEEAYSVAIEAMELILERQADVPLRIFATDLEQSAVAFARRGVYPAAALKNVSGERIARYFHQVEGGYEIVEEVRKLIVFGLHDLVQTPPFPHIDLLLCRNVLMYFTSELQTVALHALAFSLRSDGYLVLGSAESTRPLLECFTTDNAGLKVFKRNDYPAAFRSAPSGAFGTRFPLSPEHARRPVPRFPASPRPMADLDPRPFVNAETLLLGLPVGVAVVDAHYDIQSINVAAREMLGIHGVAIGDDIIHLLTSFDPAVLRKVIDAAFAEGNRSQSDEVPATESVTGGKRFYQVTCQPVNRPSNGERPVHVEIVVSDVTPAVNQRIGIQEQLAFQQSELTNVMSQLQGVSETNRRLLVANEELTNAEERWRALKDAYALANAEAAAANEELETYAEELQASGEEMEALNEELKATVEELAVSNANLDERAQELMEQRQLQEDFVDRASHELRTPLTALRGYLQLISRRSNLDNQDEAVQRIAHEALEVEARMEGLVAELMDVTRIQNQQFRLDLEACDLVSMVSRVVEVSRVMAQGQMIDLKSEVDSLVVSADVVRFEGVLYNLLTNAIKYAAGTPRIEVQLRQAGDNAEIAVRDFGPGIPKEDLPHIFDRFYQGEQHGAARRTGLGLGLYIANEVVAAHGGSIEVTSSEGEGTAFTVRLPLHRELTRTHS